MMDNKNRPNDELKKKLALFYTHEDKYKNNDFYKFLSLITDKDSSKILNYFFDASKNKENDFNNLFKKIYDFFNSDDFDKLKDGNYLISQSKIKEIKKDIIESVDKVINSTTKYIKKYEWISDLDSFNHNLLGRVIKDFKSEKRDDELIEKMTLNSVINSMYKNGGNRDMPDILFILNSYKNMINQSEFKRLDSLPTKLNIPDVRLKINIISNEIMSYCYQYKKIKSSSDRYKKSYSCNIAKILIGAIIETYYPEGEEITADMIVASYIKNHNRLKNEYIQKKVIINNKAELLVYEEVK